jgi:thioredoxin reductase (NADPH)
MTTRKGPAETPDLADAYPRLTHRQLSQLCRRGRRRPIGPGDVLVAEGQRDRDFMVVLSGKVAVVEGYDTPRSRVIRVHGQHRFLDELGLLTRQPSFVTMAAVEPGEILAVPVRALEEMVWQDPALGDLILRGGSHAGLARPALVDRGETRHV